MLIVGMFSLVLFDELTGLVLYAAFICGALSQVIKQCKGEG